MAALIVTLCGPEAIADNINKALQYVSGFICSIRIKLSYFPLEFFIVLSLKTIKNFSGQIYVIAVAYAAYESTLWYISPAQNLPNIFNLSSKQNKSAFWITVLMDLRHFLEPHLLRQHEIYFKRELCVTPAKLRVLNKFDSTSPTSTCKHPGFNVTCWTTDIKICGWMVQKYLQILLWLNIKNTSSSEPLLSFW